MAFTAAHATQFLGAPGKGAHTQRERETKTENEETKSAKKK